MEIFEINTNFTGSLVTEVEATTSKEAKQKFLTSLGASLNKNDDWSATIKNVSIPSIKPIVLTELNMIFPEEEFSNEEKLLAFIIEWCKENEYTIIVANNNEEDVDFFNINLKTKTIYAGELNITKPLTEIG